jgi:lysophospholipase L1-like esterase
LTRPVLFANIGGGRREERTIKTVLCYGDSNTWGSDPETGERFAPEVRWPGVLRQALGEGYWVVEEGLNGRTTVRDDPIEGAHKNGRTYLPACLEFHKPIDLVLIMLGTNDLKARFAASASDRWWRAGTAPGSCLM